MNLQADRVREIVRQTHPAALAPADAELVLALAQLAIDADGREDPDEIAMFFAFGKAVFELAGRDETPVPFASDEEDDVRLTSLAEKLQSRSARELAYTISYVLTIADFDIAPEEDAYIEKLREALGIELGRAEALSESVAAAITPLN
jgi:tellurite resistance protein